MRKTEYSLWKILMQISFLFDDTAFSRERQISVSFTSQAKVEHEQWWYHDGADRKHMWTCTLTSEYPHQMKMRLQQPSMWHALGYSWRACGGPGQGCLLVALPLAG